MPDDPLAAYPTTPAAGAAALRATARRYLEMGADIVGVLIPLPDGETAEVVLGARFEAGHPLVGHLVDNLPLEKVLEGAGIEAAAWADTLEGAYTGWNRRDVRMFAARRVREGHRGAWVPDVQWPPEPVPNVDLSR